MNLKNQSSPFEQSQKSIEPPCTRYFYILLETCMYFNDQNRKCNGVRATFKDLEGETIYNCLSNSKYRSVFLKSESTISMLQDFKEILYMTKVIVHQ